MKNKIKINFSDFWEGFDKTNTYFYNLLKEEFDVEIAKDPDYLFFSTFGPKALNYKCKKIFYTGENIRPPLWLCQYSFSFDYLNDIRNYRLPHYLLYNGYYNLTNKSINENLLNRKFCNFVVSNGNCKIRNLFFEKLNKYKKVDSGGRYLNNIGSNVKDKRKFQAEYKFSMSFENSSYTGYTTEKILDPMTVNSMPLYWGSQIINEEFNSNSFVSFTDFQNNMDDMIEYIIELDKNDDKYMNTLKQPWLINNEIPENNKLDNIKKFLYGIFL